MTSVADRPRILFVDDEPHILDALRRQLRREFAVETAVGAAKGLFALRAAEPFEVIVSDYLMPGINGAQFLAAARKAAPSATRMLLTGHTSLSDAAAVVNDGQVFRMLLKPVDQETMAAALRDCVLQYRLVVAERELLEQTLRGSVKALTDVLSLASPSGFGRATRMRRMASAVLDVLEVTDRWEVELAVEMSQLGCGLAAAQRRREAGPGRASDRRRTGDGGSDPGGLGAADLGHSASGPGGRGHSLLPQGIRRFGRAGRPGVRRADPVRWPAAAPGAGP